MVVHQHRKHAKTVVLFVLLIVALQYNSRLLYITDTSLLQIVTPATILPTRQQLGSNKLLGSFFDLPLNATDNTLLDLISKKSRKVLMYSPNHFGKGGGGIKYFLQVASFFQTNDYLLTISSLPTNMCKSKICVIETAKALDVYLTPDFFYLLLDYETGRALRSQPYDIYYEMGNTKFVQYGSPPRSFAIYQWQSPFDVDNDGSDLNMEDFSTIDQVLVNSEESKMQYLKATKSQMARLYATNAHFPIVEVLYPPVTLMILDETIIKAKEKTVIIMLGLRLGGLQTTKDHLVALEAVRRLTGRIQKPHQVEFHFIGNVQVGFDDYARNWTRQAEGLPITFHFAMNRDELRRTLAQSHLLWHVSGLDEGHDSELIPGDFDIGGIVESMSAAVIPIHFNRGGALEATRGCGYAIDNSIDSLVDATIHAMNISPAERTIKTTHCQEIASSFSVERFQSKLSRILGRQQMTKRFYEENALKIPHVQTSHVITAPTNGTHTAYIYIHTPSIYVRYAVRNIMETLGANWSLYVGVQQQPSMRQFIEPLLANHVQNVRYLEHNQSHGLLEDFNSLIIQEEFWDLFDTEYILLFQHDSLMFYNNMDHFIALGAPFMGSPWCPDNDAITKGFVRYRVGNGGFSLRRKSWMKRCTTSPDAWDDYNAIKTAMMHGTQSGQSSSDVEDIFFNVCFERMLPRDEWHRYEAEAAKFGIEVPCRRPRDNTQQDEQHVMGGHAFWYYTNPSEQQKLFMIEQ